MPLFKRLAVPALVAALVVLAGCGSSATPAPAASPAPAAPAQPVKITFWHAMQGPQGDALKKLVADFNTKMAGKITVEESAKGGYTELNQAITAGLAAQTSPTIAQFNDDIAASFYSEKALVSLQKYIDADADLKAELGNVAPAILKTGQYDGQQVTIPFNRSVQVLYVNTDVIKDLPKTLDDWAKVSQQVSTGNMKGTAFQPTIDYFDIFFRLAGGQWLDGNGKMAINSDAGQRALQLIVDMNKNGSAVQMEPKTYQSDYFSQGRIASFAGTSASMGYIALKGNWTVVPLPKDKADASPSYGTNIGVFAQAKPEEQKAAAEFIKFLLSPDSMAFWAIKTGYLPLNSKAADTQAWKDFVAKNPAQAVPITVANSVVFAPLHPKWSAARNIITNAVTLAVRGDKTVKAALDEAAKQVDEALAKK